MNDKVHRDWFIIGTLALMLVAASPTLAMFIHLPSNSDKFSEIWLLGPGHKAEDYPFNIIVNENYSIFLGVRNHLGYSAYYRVCVKFRNQTQPLPVASNATPSTQPLLHEFNFFVSNGEAWETLLEFEILDAQRSNSTMFLKSLSINDVTFFVNSFSEWSKTRNGFYYQLFFELWLYNMESQNFQYHNRFVAIWLNATD